MESALISRIYSIRPRTSTLEMTATAARTIWDRKWTGAFTDASDLALTTLPAPTFFEWLDRNNIRILEARL